MPLTYNEAVAAVTRAEKFGINPSLDAITALCKAMYDPQDSYSCIQITGSNGKSSTARLSAAMLRSAGYKVGLYTSPHLVKYPERIEIDGEVISDRAFADSIEAALDASKRAGIQATEFELLTAAALWLFAHERVQWAVLECGLGGRWDATSVVSPKAAVITGVALEHTAILGDTVEKIAAEKAAIIKRGSVAVLAHNIAAREVFEKHAMSVGVRCVQADYYGMRDYVEALRHLPSYQASNAATALAAVEAALGERLLQETVRAAIQETVVPGRFEVLREQPLLMVDAAHNPQSAQVLARELAMRFVTATATDAVATAQANAGKDPVPTLLLGVLADKDVRGVVDALCPLFTRVVVTASRSVRAISAKRLARIVAEQTGREPEVAETIPQALKLLKDVPVLATGSVTVAGEVKRFWC